MTKDSIDGAAGDQRDEAVEHRYGEIETGNGETVIYDRTESTAWLQSDYTVDVGI